MMEIKIFSPAINAPGIEQEYDKISIDADVDVFFYAAPDYRKITMAGDPNLMKKIKFTVVRTRLLIESEFNEEIQNKIAVYIPLKDTRVIEARSNATLNSIGMLQTPSLNIYIHENSRVNLNSRGVINIYKVPMQKFSSC